MDWDKLKIFHTVAEASSFTKASTILNLIGVNSFSKNFAVDKALLAGLEKKIGFS